MFILTVAATVTDVNGFQTYFIGLGLGHCQCEYTLKANLQEQFFNLTTE